MGVRVIEADVKKVLQRYVIFYYRSYGFVALPLMRTHRKNRITGLGPFLSSSRRKLSVSTSAHPSN